ncbi:MAG: hypothetical protein NZM43_04920 [Saprospiraceae bacterium]|nr:hypothetical protein [Saprospiraceae bacterium]MDW8483650.1 hypothetical protein [Saprospiraceae bacterium]
MRFGWFFIGILVWSCGNSSPGRYAQIANVYCECTQPLVRLNRAADSAKHTHQLHYLQQIEVAYKHARECLTPVVHEYGLLQSSELDTLMLHLQEYCPEVAQQRDLLQDLLGE